MRLATRIAVARTAALLFLAACGASDPGRGAVPLGSTVPNTISSVADEFVAPSSSLDVEATKPQVSAAVSTTTVDSTMADLAASALLQSDLPLVYVPAEARCSGPPPGWTEVTKGIAVPPDGGPLAIAIEISGSAFETSRPSFPARDASGRVIAYVDIVGPSDERLMLSIDGGGSFAEVVRAQRIRSLAISPSGERFSAAIDGTLHVAEVTNPARLEPVELPRPVPAMLPGDAVWLNEQRLVFVVDETVEGVSSEFAALANLWLLDGDRITQITEFVADEQAYTIAATPVRLDEQRLAFVALSGRSAADRSELRNELYTMSISDDLPTNVRDLPIDTYLAGQLATELLLNVPASYGEWLLAIPQGSGLAILGCGAALVEPTTGRP
jgi:hypothetical protein